MLELNVAVSKKAMWYVLNTTINSKLLTSKVIETYPNVFVELMQKYPDLVRSVNDTASIFDVREMLQCDDVQSDIIETPIVSKSKIFPPYSTPETEYIKMLQEIYNNVEIVREKCNLVFKNDRTKAAIVTKLQKIRTGK